MFNFRKNSKKIIACFFAILIMVIFLSPNFVYATDADKLNSVDELNFGGYEDEIGEELGLGDEDPRVIVAKVIRFFIGFLGIVAVGLIMYGGWLYMTSEGDEEQLTRAKNVIQSAVIGLIIILSAFAIATFILNMLYQSSTNNRSPGDGDLDNRRGIGILGSCSVESVYPEPYQEEVPRNTGIIISFKEGIDASTICDSVYSDGGVIKCCDSEAVVNGTCSAVAKIVTTTTSSGDTYYNARFYASEQEDRCDFDSIDSCVNASVYSRDNKTFVFIPDEYLGSPTEKIWYSAHITNDVLTLEGEGAFKECHNDYFSWQFEVSTKLDLTPPRILEASDSGIFPPTDDVQDDNDIPKNAVVKINFSESVNPFTISGSAQELDQFIKVTCVDCAGLDGTYDCGLLSENRSCIDGNFEIANQYQTVEFISANKCGQNNCGEDIFCLPGSNNIKVYLNAATLAVSCLSSADCTTRNPYNNCGNGICQDQNAVNYPMGILDGVVDMAMNSLDGDRDINAEGNNSTYDENTSSGEGDNYIWSFWTSNNLDQTPPIVRTVEQEQLGLVNIIVQPGEVNFSNPILVEFNELMMASSLKTASKEILGNIHSGVNLFTLDNNAQIDTAISLGYWLKSFDFGTYPSGHTQSHILHESFSDITDYRGRVGSRVKDLFQNCYMPCVGPSCLDTEGSCCNGVITTAESCSY